MSAIVMDRGKTAADSSAVSSLGSRFRIPKKKCPEKAGCMQMVSPLSRLPDSSSLKQGHWTQFSGDGRKSRGLGQKDSPGTSNITQMSSANRKDKMTLIDTMKVKPKTRLVREEQSRAISTKVTYCKGLEPQPCSNTRTPSSHRRLPLPHSPPSPPKRFRPKRASDTLCQDENLQGALSSPQGRMNSIGLRGCLQTVRGGEVEEKMTDDGDDSSPGDTGRLSSSAGIKEGERERRARSQVKGGNTGVTRGLPNPTEPLRQSSPYNQNQKRGGEPAHKPAGSKMASPPAVQKLLEEPTRTCSHSQRPGPLLRRPRKPGVKSSEPIVLSSDEEEVENDAGTIRCCLNLSKSKDELPQETGWGSWAAMTDMPQAEAKTSGVHAGGPAGSPEKHIEECSVVELPFSRLHAGKTSAEANGNILVTEDCIIIPLKEPAGEAEVSLTLVPLELVRYGVWAVEPTDPMLFIWVSDAQALLIQKEMSVLRHTGTSEPACPYLLLTLKESLDGLQRALFASLMDVMGLRCGKQALVHPISLEQALDIFSSSSWAKTILPFLEKEPSLALGKQDQTELTKRLEGTTRRSLWRAAPSWDPGLSPSRRLIVFPPPPSKGGISVRMEDLDCLNSGEFLNDVVIDFYLKYLTVEKAPREMVEKSYVFSSFFYKQLTRRGGVGVEAAGVSPKYKRHNRVRTWTRNVDIFTKDFLFLPVNQEAHWYLVVICFPWLEAAVSEDWRIPTARGNAGVEIRGGAQRPKGKSTCGTGTPNSLPECTKLGCQRETVCKRPCILVLDSLKLSPHDQIFRLSREYLEVEWEVRRGTPRGFTVEQMPGYHCKVPLQDNSSDCGLYLLQYAESFLQNPVVHFDLPPRLEHWFPRQQVRRKRDEIRELVVQLYRKQRGRSRVVEEGGSSAVQEALFCN